MAPERHTQDSSRSRHSHRSRRDRDDASSVDSGYGGSAANSPKDTHDVQKDALRDYHAESARHHAESGRRSSRSDEPKAADPKSDGEERELNSDSDYDPRDKYYLKVDEDEYNNMTSAAVNPAKDGGERHVSESDRKDDRRRSDASEGHRSERRRSSASERDRRERRDRRESDASNSSRRSERERNRERDRDRDRDRHNSAIARRQSITSDGSDSSERRGNRRHSSSRHSDTSSTRSESHDQKQLRRRSDASTASHSRHDSNYRSLSPIPSDSWDSSDESLDRSPRRRATSRSTRTARSEAGGSRKPTSSPDKSGTGNSKSRDASARYIDPDGEAAKSFLDKITKGVDMKSVGKVGLDAAAVAAIKIAVGTQVPWKQRIPRTITVGAAAAIMDFVVKKTNFKPKGMIGTIYARQFVEIVLANLIVNPVSSKVTGAAQGAKGKVAAGKPGAGGGRR